MPPPCAGREFQHSNDVLWWAGWPGGGAIPCPLERCTQYCEGAQVVVPQGTRGEGESADAEEEAETEALPTAGVDAEADADCSALMSVTTAPPPVSDWRCTEIFG